MKPFFGVVVSLFFLQAIPAPAQHQRQLQQVADALAAHEFFVRYHQFCLQFEQLNIQAGVQLKYKEDYVVLNLAYRQVQHAYNAMLSMVKKDLSDPQSFQYLQADPALFVLKYQQAHADVQQVYTQTYLPILGDVQTRFKKIYTPLDIPTLPSLSKEGAQQLVRIIESRSDAENWSLNATLGILHQKFYQKLKMKNWLSLEIPTPTLRRPAATEAQAHPFMVAAPPVDDFSEKTDPPSDVAAAEVEPTLFEKMVGWLKMFIANAQKEPVPVNFLQTLMQEVEIEVPVLRDGKSEMKKKTIQIAEIDVENLVSANTQFQLKVSTTSGMYIFSQNSSGKVQWLYPFDSREVAKCGSWLHTRREAEDAPASFVVGQNSEGIITVPVPNCGTQPPSEQFLSFSAVRPEDGFERIVVLLAHAPINTEQVARQLESARGDLFERLAVVFHQHWVNPIAANVEINNEHIQFSHQHAERSILPLVLILKRL